MTHALIVDDSKTACRILERKLANLQVQSSSVLSAEEAFSFLEHHKPDVIFMDHNMPVINGLEAVKILRDNQNTAAIPVLMYTSEAGEYYVGQARALGVIDVLPKELGSDYIGSALAQLGLIEAKEKAPEEDSADTNECVDTGHIDTPKNSNESPAIEPPLVQAAKPEPNNGDRTSSPLDNAKFSEKIIRNITNEVRGFVRHINQRMKRELYITSVDIQQALEDQLDHQNSQFIKTLKQQHAQLHENVELQTKLITLQTNKIRNIAIVSALFLCAMGAGLLYNTQQFHQLKLSHQMQNTAFVELVLNIQQRMDEQSEQLEEALLQSSANKNTAVTEQGQVILQNTQGLLIGRIIHWDEKQNTLLVINNNNYMFKLHSSGLLSSKLPTRFYLSDDCYGNAMIEGFKGMVFKQSNNQVWYTPKDQTTQQSKPLSAKFSDGICTKYAGSTLTLLQVEVNDEDVTGIDDINLGPLDRIGQAL